MYNELDDFLDGYLPINYWYDEGVTIAQEIIEKFTDMDWKVLITKIPKKSYEWKRKIAYCLDNENNMFQLNLLLEIIDTDDEELFDICVDSLRSFESCKSKDIILSNPLIVKRVEERIKSAGIATKGILQNFLDNLNR